MDFQFIQKHFLANIFISVVSSYKVMCWVFTYGTDKHHITEIILFNNERKNVFCWGT